MIEIGPNLTIAIVVASIMLVTGFVAWLVPVKLNASINVEIPNGVFQLIPPQP